MSAEGANSVAFMLKLELPTLFRAFGAHACGMRALPAKGLLWPECERKLDGAARRDDAPALSVYLDVWQALGGVNQYALDLLRRERRVCFEHAGDRGGDEGRGERCAVNELVVLAYHVGLLELDEDELAQEVEGKRSRFVEVAVNVAVFFDERAQFFVGGAIQFRVKLRLVCRGRVREYGRGNPDAGRDHVGLL